MAEKKAISLHALLLGAVGFMAFTMLLLVAWLVLREERAAQEIRWISLATRMTDATIQASALAARERGLHASLHSARGAEPHPQHAELDALRERGNTFHREIVDLVAAMAAEAPDHPLVTSAGLLSGAHAAADEARRALEQTGGNGHGVQVAGWIETMTRYIDVLTHLRRESAMMPDSMRAGTDGFMLLDAAAQASEHAGRERAIVATAIAAGRPLTSRELIELQNYRAIVEENLGDLSEYASHHPGPLGSAFGRIQQEVLEGFESTRAAIYQASRARKPYPLSSEAWFARATSAIDSILAFSGQVRQENLARLAAAEHANARAKKLLVATIVLVVMLIILMLLGLRRRVLLPLEALAVAARNIARGDISEPIRPARGDEIGALAMTFEDMRQTLRRDMQKIRAAEAAVRDQELRLRNIIDMAGEAVISVDQRQKIILFNKSAEVTFGYRQEEALGQTIDILIPEEARSRHHGHVQGFAGSATDARLMMERGLIQGRRRDGSLFPAEASISKLRMGDEQIFTVILRDISERRRAEEAQARLIAIVESSTDIIVTEDHDGNIFYLNRAGRQFLGLGETDGIAGLRISDLLTSWSLSQARHEGIPYAIRDGFWHGESDLRDRQGRDIPVSQLLLAHKDTQGRLRYLSCVMRDISERKETEKELRTRQRELEAAYKTLAATQSQLLQSEKMASIGQLAAGVAHEINNPVGYVNSNLGTLQGYVNDLFRLLATYEKAEPLLAADPALQAEIVSLKQTLDLAFLREDTLNLVRESQEGLTRVKKIVQDLKEFSHVDRAEWQQADLHLGIDSTLNIVHNELKYKAEIVKDYGTLPPVECIPAQLNQVFMNILVNAAQAMDSRGVITIRTGMEDAGVYVEITDTGQGMPEEVRKRIFEPFFTTKPVGKGTGLGLSLSYSIVQKHHGRIDVTSTPGQGTTFRVWVPVGQAGSGEETQASRGMKT